MRKMLCVLLFFTLPQSLIGQIRPVEGASLNYTIIGFSFKAAKKKANCTFQIAQGHYYNEDSFVHNIAITVKGDDNNRAIARVPAFGKEYTWRAIESKGGKETTSSLYHFSTRMAKMVDPDSNRLRIITPASAHQDDFIFLDGSKTLYDVAGNPVWYLPDVDGKSNDSERPRDIRVSPFGTITLLAVDQIYEINYDADILWNGPDPANSKKKRDSTSFHHHEFTRLANGNYMSFGFERVFWPLSRELKDTVIINRMKGKISYNKDSGRYYQKISFGRLIEYDRNGKVVWQWRASEYIKHSDLYQRMFANIYELDDTHVNAFYFDEKKNFIYVSFRNLSRIVKIEYPSGKVLAEYGNRNVPGKEQAVIINQLFCGQHGCRESMDGYLYVYNNNICHPALTPTIVMMRESPVKKDSLEKVWEFKCPMDELTPKEKSTTVFNVGGNTIELPDRSFFCCMGSEYSKTFIVDTDKNIVWCAQPEKWDNKNGKWKREFQYRGSVISRKELEHLIWNEPLETN